MKLISSILAAGSKTSLFSSKGRHPEEETLKK